VIGTGRIGMHSIRIARGFGMEVIANDIHENGEAAAEWGFRYAPLEVVLANSDAISLHVSLNESTHHLINPGRLEQMKSVPS
jgi:D-lactate dehydrogenase